MQQQCCICIYGFSNVQVAYGNSVINVDSSDGFGSHRTMPGACHLVQHEEELSQTAAACKLLYDAITVSSVVR